ncbi:MAG TPA: cyclic nucleotide-binding domain-containing protein [Hyphomicrobiaceae bacterium]|nr:cyclic nucleotide-binding domain-containing protein [Hyphomicrobiaceae bacterium]
MAVVDALLVHFLNVEIFRGLKPLQITEIARRAERVVFRPGQALIEHGRTGNAALLIVSDGAVRTLGPDRIPLNEPIQPGSLIAEMAMLIEAEHTSTVLAQAPVRAFRIAREGLEAQMVEDPTLAEHFVDKIAARLRRLTDELKKVDAILAGVAAQEATEGDTSRVRETA